MNSMATSGKNLQTPELGEQSKGAREIGLVAPSVPDHQHHALFRSLAPRRRMPSPQPITPSHSSARAPCSVLPLVAKQPTPRPARNYGGRDMRYRWEDDLKPWQLHMLHEADAVATQIGAPLDTFVTVNYHGTFAGGAAMASTFKTGLKRMCQWLRDNGIPVAYSYVHENPQDEKPNSHLLVHLPANKRLRWKFRSNAAAWFNALDGGVKVEARNDADRLAKGLGTRLKYMGKGAPDLVCRLYEGRRARGGQGPISFKRAGVSQLLRRSAFPMASQVTGAAA